MYQIFIYIYIYIQQFIAVIGSIDGQHATNLSFYHEVRIQRNWGSIYP